MAFSHDDEWMLAENLKRQEKEDIANIQIGKDGSHGHFGSYYALLTGENTEWVKAHAISDERYVSSYARQLKSLLVTEMRSHGDIRLLDVGCGPGVLTRALARSLPNCRARGIDISESAIEYGRKWHQDCRFDAVFVDGATDLGERFEIVHAREFYPFTRSDDFELHRLYVQALARHVAESGVLIISLLSSPDNLTANAAALAPVLEAAGMSSFRRVALANSRIPGWVPPSIARAATALLTLCAGRGTANFYISRRVRLSDS